MKKQIPYSEAMAQVEALVRRIESGEIDVDDLAESVQRASTLLADCRARLRSAQDAVNDSLRSLEESPDAQSAGVRTPESAVVERD